MMKFSDVEDAFLFVGSDQPDMNSAIINKKSGEIYYQSELTGTDEFPEDCDDGDYISIPHKNDLDLGRDLVFDFVASKLPNRYDEVAQIFRSRGAYSRFKSLLDSLGLLDAWHKFEDDTTKSALRQWCKKNGLHISE